MEKMLIMISFQETSEELKARIPDYFVNVIGRNKNVKKFVPYVWGNSIELLNNPYSFSVGILVDIPEEKGIWNLISSLMLAIRNDEEISTHIYSISYQRDRKKVTSEETGS